VVERRTTGRTRVQVEVAEAVRQVVGPPAVHSLLQDLDELLACETCQTVIDTRVPDVAIAVSVEVLAAPTWTIHRLVVTHQACGPSRVWRRVDLGEDLGADQGNGQRQVEHLLGVRPAWARPTAVLTWESTTRLLQWPTPPGQAPSVVDETSNALYEQGLAVVLRPEHLQRLPMAEGWRLAYSSTQFALHSADGAIACAGPLRFEAGGWWESVQTESCCLVVAGVGLGLGAGAGAGDHHQRLVAAMAHGRVVAAVAICEPQDAVLVGVGSRS
jgi:hypothetical protein